jgi:hypothetical protein
MEIYNSLTATALFTSSKFIIYSGKQEGETTVLGAGGHVTL